VLFGYYTTHDTRDKFPSSTAPIDPSWPADIRIAAIALIDLDTGVLAGTLIAKAAVKISLHNNHI
jgi:hypothetical protein